MSRADRPTETNKITPPAYVRFTLGDKTVEGPVVDYTHEGHFNNPFRTRLTVEVDGHRWTVLQRDTTEIPPPELHECRPDQDDGHGHTSSHERR